MSAKLTFVRRSAEEIKTFGGSVYADVDGKNIAIINSETITIDVAVGSHKVKMYKSHSMNTFIGFAEVEVTISEGEHLTFTYSPPFVVTQPGNIMVADFVSYSEIEKNVKEKENKLTTENMISQEKKRREEEETKKNYWWIILLVLIIPTLISIIYYAFIVAMIWD